MRPPLGNMHLQKWYLRKLRLLFSPEEAKKDVPLRNPETGGYFRFRKDEVDFRFQDLADEADLQQELERIRARLADNRKHVEARCSSDPAKKDQLKQIMYTSRCERAARKPLFLKDEDEGDSGPTPTGEEPAALSSSPTKEKTKQVRKTMIGLNVGLHFKERPKPAYCRLCEGEAMYFCLMCGDSVCSNCRLLPEGLAELCTCVLPPDLQLTAQLSGNELSREAGFFRDKPLTRGR